MKQRATYFLAGIVMIGLAITLILYSFRSDIDESAVAAKPFISEPSVIVQEVEKEVPPTKHKQQLYYLKTVLPDQKEEQSRFDEFLDGEKEIEKKQAPQPIVLEPGDKIVIKKHRGIIFSLAIGYGYVRDGFYPAGGFGFIYVDKWSAGLMWTKHEYGIVFSRKFEDIPILNNLMLSVYAADPFNDFTIGAFLTVPLRSF